MPEPWARCSGPDEVAVVVERGLLEPNPKRGYLRGPEADEAQITIRKLLSERVQLNEGGPTPTTTRRW